ncbi:DNA-processing protein DprA [Streptomyces sp. NPDC049555]|uniref:DNA-processing protein DprA n=1 Tax=Streptomyces sp. NPDC049555 TaxID=3154930 RepID=UPI003417B423
MHHDTHLDRTERAARIALTEAMTNHGITLTPYAKATDVLALAPELIRQDTPLSKGLAGALAYDGERALTEGEDSGARYLIPTDPEWPAALRATGPLAPLGLWVKGTPCLTESASEAVAMVGPAAASDYGTHCASYLADGLATFGHNTVAAAIGPNGVGAAALTACSMRNGLPIGVLAGGYPEQAPAATLRFFDSILNDGGLLVSLHRPGAPTSRTRMVKREALIGALAQAVTVVEGASGKWETAARVAEHLGRPLLAIPGPITSSLSDLPNKLIAERRAQAVRASVNIIARIHAARD